MSLLTNRQKQILLFLTKFKGILTAKRISEELGVSDKTVRNDIKVLQGESQKIGAKIHIALDTGMSRIGFLYEKFKGVQ